jgi:hypothetical protein
MEETDNALQRRKTAVGFEQRIVYLALVIGEYIAKIFLLLRRIDGNHERPSMNPCMNACMHAWFVIMFCIFY